MKTLTKADITEEMLDAWIEEQREVFKDDPDSMDLVNLCIKWIDKENQNDSPDQEKIAKYRQSLRGFYENTLGRDQGILVCENCGNKLEVYYTMHCFHCEKHKPKLENGKINYLMAVKYVSNQEEDFDKDELWDCLCNLEMLQGNDRDMHLWEAKYIDNETYKKNIELFAKHYPEYADVTWFVSW